MSGAFTHHGGNLAAAARHFGGRVADWLDLSTGLNPQPWPGAEAMAVDWRALPDPGALLALEAAAARHFGVDPALCCAVPGSEMAMRLLGRWLGGPGAYFAPAYRTHAAAFPDAVALGWPCADVPDDRRALILANPNNPDGRIIGAERLRIWHDALARRGGWLVVDEAFADAAPAHAVAGRVGCWDRLIVLRSFGKFFGLAGVRLGFVLGPPEVLAAMRAMLGDWPLGSGALAMGRAAYADHGWIVQTRRALRQRAARMDRLLGGHGLRVIGDCPQFRLIVDGGAPALFARLARHAILTRPFEDHPTWLRLGVPATEADFARLARGLGDA